MPTALFDHRNTKHENATSLSQLGIDLGPPFLVIDFSALLIHSKTIAWPLIRNADLVLVDVAFSYLDWHFYVSEKDCQWLTATRVWLIPFLPVFTWGSSAVIHLLILLPSPFSLAERKAHLFQVNYRALGLIKVDPETLPFFTWSLEIGLSVAGKAKGE